MEDVASKVIEHAMSQGAEFADLRLESSQGTNVLVMDGKTKTVSSRVTAGCGIRAFIEGAWGFAVTNDTSAKSLSGAAESAVRMAKVAKERAKVRFSIASSRAERAKVAYRCELPPSEIATADKVSFAASLDKSMREVDPRIVSTNSRYDDHEGDMVMANSHGTVISVHETWTLASCSAWAKSDGIVQRGHESVGMVGGYELMQTDETASLGSKAAAQAIRLLDSKPSPAGKFVCILDNKMAGMLAHEAFGHACEADAVLAGSSVLEGRAGQKVACNGVTLADDPSVLESFGYFSFDWEGVKASKHVLIDDGILKGYLHNLETSSRMGVEPSGSARAQNYASPPIVRMSNTYIAPGEWKKDDLIEDTRAGLLIQGSQYGYVEPSKGQFMFKCDEAYAIKNGEVGERYRDASLSGVILEVLTKVTGVADDFMLGDPGYCGKSGQAARTSTGGPHMRVADIVVGGLV